MSYRDAHDSRADVRPLLEKRCQMPQLITAWQACALAEAAAAEAEEDKSAPEEGSTPTVVTAVSVA